MPLALSHLDLGERQRMTRILISNAVTVGGPRDIGHYGVKAAAELVREFGLAGIELTTRWGMSSGWVRKQIGGVSVIGVHASWTWQYCGQNRWNHRATFMENVKGKLAWLIQPPMKYPLARNIAIELGAEYLCLHPDIFAGIDNEYVKLQVFSAAHPILLVENNCEEGHEGVGWALNFAHEVSARGILLDTNHLGLVPSDNRAPESAYGVVRKKVKAVHLSDLSRATGRAKLIPGTGELEWLPRLFEWLKDDGFEGPYVLEVRHPGVPPREAVKRSLKYLSGYGIHPG